MTRRLGVCAAVLVLGVGIAAPGAVAATPVALMMQEAREDSDYSWVGLLGLVGLAGLLGRRRTDD